MTITLWCGGCQFPDRAPTQPAVLPAGVHVNQQASDGCTRFALRVVNGTPMVEALYNSSGCPTDHLKLETDSTPLFDAALGRLRVPITIRNTGSTPVVAPSRIRFVADSSQFLNGQGQVIPGLPDIVAANYDSGSTNGRVGQWRYDTLLAASGSVQVLAPGAVSRRRWLEFAGTSWNQIVRIKLPTVGALVPPVPAVPPDSTPVGLYSVANVVTDTIFTGAPILRDAISIEFVDAATQLDRQVIVGSIGGLVIGGMRSSATTGFYYVRLVPLPTLAQLHAIVAALRRNRLVDEVDVVLALDVPSDFLAPNDGTGWVGWQTRSSFSGSGPREALERLRLPLAWGCSVGSSTVRVAVVDYDIRTTSDLAFNSTLSVGLGSILTTEEHGTRVASVLAATGNNGAGMTGAMWTADLRGYERSIGGRLPPRAIMSNIALAVRAGARIVNSSSSIAATWNQGTWHGGSRQDSAIVQKLDSAYQATLRRLKSAGHDPLLVLPAGNFVGGVSERNVYWSGNGSIKALYPNNVLVVGAGAQHGGTLWGPSGRGGRVTVAALGENVFSATQADLTGSAQSGTSLATPQVAGIAGLLLAFDPRLNAGDLVQLIEQGAVRSGRAASGVPLADAYESLKLAAQRPGAPLCGNPVTYTATFDTIANLQSISAYTKRAPGSGGFEHLATFVVPGSAGAPVYVPHGGKELLLDPGDALGLRRVAAYNGSSWQSLGSPWAIVSDSSVTGVTWSSRGWTHDGDTALYATKNLNPGSISANVSWALWSGGTLGAPLASFSNLPERWTAPGGGANAGAVAVGGTIAPSGDFAIGFVTDGSEIKSYRFYRIGIPSGGASHLFTDTLDLTPGFPSSYSGPSPWFGLTVSEDGSEFWYTAPRQDDTHYFGCILKRYSITAHQFVSTDVLPSGGSGISACTPISLAWQGGAARISERKPQVP